MNPHRFLDLAAEHVDPEDLSVIVALSESKAVALWCAIMASHTEQNLVDRVVGDFCTGVWVQQPVQIKNKNAAITVCKTSNYLESNLHIVHTYTYSSQHSV